MASGVADSSFVGADPRPAREHGHNEGHGRRLTAAFEALEGFPVLAESRKRLLALFSAGEPSREEVVAGVESDVALTIAVLRLANHVAGTRRGHVESVAEAVEALSIGMVRAITSPAPALD